MANLASVYIENPWYYGIVHVHNVVVYNFCKMQRRNIEHECMHKLSSSFYTVQCDSSYMTFIAIDNSFDVM